MVKTDARYVNGLTYRTHLARQTAVVWSVLLVSLAQISGRALTIAQ